MTGASASRKRIVSRAWALSLALHAALAAALSYSYVTHRRLHVVRPPEAAPVEVTFLREPNEVPSQPLAELRCDPPPASQNWELRATETPDEMPPVTVTALEDEPVPAQPTEVLPEAQPPEAVSVRFDAARVVKRMLARQQRYSIADVPRAAGDGGGGAQTGSGGASARLGSNGDLVASRGGSGAGSGTGIGAGSGAGNRSGLGSAASGNGFGTGQGDGMGSGNGGRGGAIASKPARVRHIAAASYPRDAQRAGYEGLVKVLIHVLPSGAISDVHVVQSSGYDSLDSAACSAARQCRIDPMEQDGRPVACSFTIPYRFTLRGR